MKSGFTAYTYLMREFKVVFHTKILPVFNLPFRQNNNSFNIFDTELKLVDSVNYNRNIINKQKLFWNRRFHSRSDSSRSDYHIFYHDLTVRKRALIFHWLKNQHSVAVSIKAILFFDGFFISLHHKIKSSKSTNHHKQSRFGHVEIGNHAICNTKIIRGKNKFIRPSCRWFHFIIGGN